MNARSRMIRWYLIKRVIPKLERTGKKEDAEAIRLALSEEYEELTLAAVEAAAEKAPEVMFAEEAPAGDDEVGPIMRFLQFLLDNQDRVVALIRTIVSLFITVV